MISKVIVPDAFETLPKFLTAVLNKIILFNLSNKIINIYDLLVFQIDKIPSFRVSSTAS